MSPQVVAMSETPQIWHYGRCSKSRRAKGALEDAGIDHDTREYRKEAPTPGEVRALVDRVDDAEALVRDKDAPEALDDATRGDPDALAQALAEHPEALQRPVIVHGDTAWVARDEATVERALDALR